MNLVPAKELIRERLGLRFEGPDEARLRRAIQQRMTALGMDADATYLAQLHADATELAALAGLLTIKETYFYRESQHLRLLTEHLAPRLLGDRDPGTPVRILSAGCATGEEPYSLAMAFALAGWPLELLRIDAVDISRQNLERAARGIYGRNSFRGDDLKFRTAFLEAAGNDTWRVSDRLRAPITFEFGNLLADDFAAARRRYDAIFCRNLLIYFDRATQARAVGTLDRLLAPEGWFAVGPAEPTLLFAHGYELVKVRSAFLLRRPTPGLPSPLPPLSKRPPAGPTPPVPWREVARPAPPEAVRPAADQAAADAEALSEIQQLADAGRLREARTRGEALLARRSASAPLLFLLGVVAEASGDTTRAEELFRKTIYLDPTHTEALGHLATRAELNGDRRAAHTFRERAQRALKKEVR